MVRLFVVSLLWFSCYGDDFNCKGRLNCRIRKWNENTNFQNRNNWVASKRPCSFGTAKFPNFVPSVAVASETKLKELVLPHTGSLILNDNLIFSDKEATTCENENEVAEYSRTQRYSWFDPTKWCTQAEVLGSIRTECDATHGIDSDLIPSQYDQVYFQPQDTVFINVDGIETSGWDEDGQKAQLFGLKFRDQTFYSAATFQQYLRTNNKSEELELVTNQSPQLKMEFSHGCSSSSGCVPYTLNDKVKDTICKYVTCDASQLQCAHPTTPKGACCKRCGELIKLEIAGDYKWEVFRRSFHDVLLKHSTYSQTGVSLMKISDREVQIFLTGTKSDVISGELVATLAENHVFHGITEVQWDSATGKHKGIVLISNSGINESTKQALIIIAVFILILGVGFAWFSWIKPRYYNTGRLSMSSVGRWCSASFIVVWPSGIIHFFRNRFTQSSQRHQFDVSFKSARSVSHSSNQPTSMGFDNPVFEDIQWVEMDEHRSEE